MISLHTLRRISQSLIFTLCISIFFYCLCSNTAYSEDTAPQEPTIKRVRLIWGEAPATQATIAWDGDKGSITYGLRGHALDQEANIDHSNNAKGMHNRFVRLSNLLPDHAYDLAIKTDAGSSKQYWFLTAPDTAKAFTYISGGDSRNHRDARRSANLMVSKLRPLFVAFAGDMTASDNDKQWHLWFTDWELTTGADGRLIPIIPGRGNHERQNASIQDLFDAPQSEIYYATRIGGNFFSLYTLNTEIDVAGAQAAWLSQDLQQHQAQWKTAQYHKPMRPHVARKKEGLLQYHAWAGLFYQYGFNLVNESDAHCVKVTWPLRPSQEPDSVEGFVRDDAHGTVYAGEGCWGAPTRPADDIKAWTRDAGSFNQFKWVHVYPDKMELRTILTDNAASVATSDDSDPFASPANLKVWNPENGNVVTILPHPTDKP